MTWAERIPRAIEKAEEFVDVWTHNQRKGVFLTAGEVALAKALWKRTDYPPESLRLFVEKVEAL